MKIHIIAAFALLAQVAMTSPLTIPSYSNLFERADLVITGQSEKTAAKETHRGIRFFDTVEVWSTFQIMVFLKGSASNNVVSVMHYKQLPHPSGFEPKRA